jgi:hypothetical protein
MTLEPGQPWCAFGLALAGGGTATCRAPLVAVRDGRLARSRLDYVRSIDS